MTERCILKTTHTVLRLCSGDAADDSPCVNQNIAISIKIAKTRDFCNRESRFHF